MPDLHVPGHILLPFALSPDYNPLHENADGKFSHRRAMLPMHDGIWLLSMQPQRSRAHMVVCVVTHGVCELFNVHDDRLSPEQYLGLVVYLVWGLHVKHGPSQGCTKIQEVCDVLGKLVEGKQSLELGTPCVT